ncbi:MAG: response regulator transcription factor [Chitinophagaceae bacterium]|nr:response regulator transcription factor [Silvanigrellaceae bacterium]MBY0480247.1 response regulator transcription factor [Chitinophagaceae bacterium]
MKLLLVEDEVKIALTLKKGLEEQGYQIDLAYDGFEGTQKFELNKYDLILLDINLPKRNGHDLCKLIRTKNDLIPIIMLTAFNTMDSKLKGFDYGADDYISKPFEFKELVARIRALLKRANKLYVKEIEILKLGDLEMNMESREVRRGDVFINLTVKEFQLLEYFLRNINKVLSRAEIAKKVWDIDFDTQTNVIDVYVNYLRNKIDKEFSTKLLHTQIGSGYILKK